MSCAKPTSAPRARTAAHRADRFSGVGVGTMPRSTTSQPAAIRPAVAAATTIGPDGRVSRQTSTRPPSR